jgi:hypothetical protein
MMPRGNLGRLRRRFGRPHPAADPDLTPDGPKRRTGGPAALARETSD